jgi:protein JSN1
MPSSLQDASQRYPDPAEPSPPLPVASVSVTPVRTSALSPAYPTTPSTRPALRHTASSAANLETPTSANRLRSGSLTLPQDNFGNAFGSSPFSSTWLSNPGPARSPLAPSGQTVDTSSFTSPGESATSLGADDLNFSTLDYLGLADGGELTPASMSELRNQHQKAIANSGPASRLRASTVSNFARPYRQSVTTSPAYPTGYHDAAEEAALARALGNLDMYESSDGYGQQYNPYAGSYGKDNNRPRATTIGALDNPLRRSNAIPGHLASIPQSPVQGGFMSQTSMGPYGYPPRSRSDRDLVRSRDSSRAPRLSISSHTSRAGTPDVGGSATPQMPTRSLWIGNLDVSATSDALLVVFAPYGAIESVRMLPEKVCRVRISK